MSVSNQFSKYSLNTFKGTMTLAGSEDYFCNNNTLFAFQILIISGE